MGTIIRLDPGSMSLIVTYENRFGCDRREPFERRKGYGMLHSTEEGLLEHRCIVERRRSYERRLGWFRMGRWSSFCDNGSA